ncbi:uncharacterized protein PAC_11205 [Phialocephala subalpina]|uniref:Geranylgeranyl pyrophosphate synthetase n=1 Tax=Phialocephala subalpina TaxID=576137 RepID=A0A1L7X8F3_9HELO|nr:uncharacterized protein PAC_11205 [Phialocephala subalpina]
MSSNSQDARPNRRGGRGFARGGWRGRGSSHTSTTPQQQPRANEPFGPRIDSFNAKTLLVEKESPGIKDVKYVGSYNWLNTNAPVILVPGSPPAWTPPAQDVKLNRDRGAVYRDTNAARYASYPMEPAVRAVLAMQSQSELPSVDIFGCGSTIGSLLRCARSESMPFRFDIDVIGNTVFMVRRGESPTEMITDLQGYGQTFPETYTTWDADVRNSCSHQRIISYDFGGMQFLVRSETDGYIRTSTAEPTSSTESGDDVSIDTVLNTMGNDVRQSQEGTTLEVRAQGTPIPQDQIFDIKTRASYKQFDMEDILPRLWVNQTPNFLLAYHEFGLFNKPKVTSVQCEVLKWQKDNSSLLARFHALIKRIMDVVRDSDGQQFEISWDGQGPLCITKQIATGRMALPTDLSTLWEAL